MLLGLRFAGGREPDEKGEELEVDFLRDSLDRGGDLVEEAFLGALGGSGR